MVEGSARQRRNKGKKKVEWATTEHHPSEKGDEPGVAEDFSPSLTFLNSANVAVGVTIMIALGYVHAKFMATIHENDMWFSNIREVEREISFRTESGLYYSYYKQLVNAASLTQGLQDLMKDNHTEHPTTINVLERMNVYQEVFLASLYRTIPFVQGLFEPVYFYINTIFALHGMLVCALYVMTWLLSGSWMGGALTALMYIFNRLDTTRVEYVIPLRESFALPFLWLQLAGITYYFKHNVAGLNMVLSVLAIHVGTFFFALFWQFNQFILLLQACALFCFQLLGFGPSPKIRMVYYAQWLSIVAVAVLQFNNLMIYGGLLFAFLPPAILLNRFEEIRPCQAGIVGNIIRLVFIVMVFLPTVVSLNVLFKGLTQVDSDEHIYKFLLAKFGFAQFRDFDVKLYQCNEAFGFLKEDIIVRMTSHLTFPAYVVVHGVGLIALAVAFLKYIRVGAEHKRCRSCFTDRPELAYHLIQTVFFCVMAAVALRMKYLWTPYVCVLASLLVCDKFFYSWLLDKFHISTKTSVEFLRHILTSVFIGFLLYKSLPGELSNLENLREFWDPDTVELMEWISKSTPPQASFSGSMQLMAGVKLCTGRPITNHPHYEHKALRSRTKELYSYYGRTEPEEMHRILTKYRADYIILEESICLSQGSAGCRLKDIIDADRGQALENETPESGQRDSEVPRFCREVRMAGDQYGKLFELMFRNKTFLVYKVVQKKKV